MCFRAKKKEEAGKKAVYPCVFKIVDDRCIFNKKDPYILGIDVLEGVLKIGTPVCIPNKPWTGDAKTQETATELLEFGQVDIFHTISWPSVVYLLIVSVYASHAVVTHNLDLR